MDKQELEQFCKRHEAYTVPGGLMAAANNETIIMIQERGLDSALDALSPRHSYALTLENEELGMYRVAFKEAPIPYKPLTQKTLEDALQTMYMDAPSALQYLSTYPTTQQQLYSWLLADGRCATKTK